MGSSSPAGGHGGCAGCRVRVIEGAPARRRTAGLGLSARNWPQDGAGVPLQGGPRSRAGGRAVGDVILADQSPLEFTPRRRSRHRGRPGHHTVVAQLLICAAVPCSPCARRSTEHGLGRRRAEPRQAALDPEVRRRIVAELRQAVGGWPPASRTSRAPRRGPWSRSSSRATRSCTTSSATSDLRRSPARRSSRCGWGSAACRPSKLGWTVGGDRRCGFFLPRRFRRQRHPLRNSGHPDDGARDSERAGGSGHERRGRRRQSRARPVRVDRRGSGVRGWSNRHGHAGQYGAIAEVALDGDACAARSSATSRRAGSAAADWWMRRPADSMPGDRANGRLAGGAAALEILAPVRLSQQDIRQLQLAKAAIAAGVRILRRRFGLADEVEVRSIWPAPSGTTSTAPARAASVSFPLPRAAPPRRQYRLAWRQDGAARGSDEDFTALARAHRARFPCLRPRVPGQSFARETVFPAASTDDRRRSWTATQSSRASRPWHRRNRRGLGHELQGSGWPAARPSTAPNRRVCRLRAKPRGRRSQFHRRLLRQHPGVRRRDSGAGEDGLTFRPGVLQGVVALPRDRVSNGGVDTV